MPHVELPTGISMYYEREGAGSPVLLIIGTGGDHTFWSEQVPAYSDGYEVITYDARGTGQSDSPPDHESYTMASMADDAVALLDAIGVERAHVSGLSLGSTVAQELAISHSEKLASLQLHATWGRSDEWFQRMIDSLIFPLERGDVETMVKADFLWVASPTFLEERPEEVEAIERAYIAENPHPPTNVGLRGHLHADREHDALERLHTISVPTLITSGELDWMVPTRYGREVQERIAGSRLHVFEGPHSSHLAFVEMAEAFNTVTRAFLDEQPALV